MSDQASEQENNPEHEHSEEHKYSHEQEECNQIVDVLGRIASELKGIKHILLQINNKI